MNPDKTAPIFGSDDEIVSDADAFFDRIVSFYDSKLNGATDGQGWR